MTYQRVSRPRAIPLLLALAGTSAMSGCWLVVDDFKDAPGGGAGEAGTSGSGGAGGAGTSGASGAGGAGAAGQAGSAGATGGVAGGAGAGAGGAPGGQSGSAGSAGNAGTGGCEDGSSPSCSADKKTRRTCDKGAIVEEPCPKANSVCIGAGQCVECEPTAVRCQAGAQAVEVCGDDGTWVPPTEGCAASGKPICEGGVCVGVTQMAAGSAHTCALTEAHTVYCWGKNDSGQLGLGMGPLGQSAHTPQKVAVPGSPKQLALGYSYSCVLNEDEQAYCWGLNTSGQAGLPSAGQIILTPRLLDAVPVEKFAQLASGYDFACGIVGGGASREVYCWGSSLAVNYDPDTKKPLKIQGLVDVAQLSTGYDHACAIEGAAVKCWGQDGIYELGVNLTNNNGDEFSHVPLTPMMVPPDTVQATILVGSDFSILWTIGSSGPKYPHKFVWGSNDKSQLKIVDGGSVFTSPTEISSSGIESVVTGYKASGVVYQSVLTLQGYNTDGRLGAPKDYNTAAPISHKLPLVAGAVMGDGHTCAWQNGGKAWCFGVNTDGQLGLNTNDPEQLTPTPVVW